MSFFKKARFQFQYNNFRKGVILFEKQRGSFLHRAIIHAGLERNCPKREWVLLFLEMRCNIFETIYFNLSPYPSPAREEGKPAYR
jgi:hypothetical protein